MKTDKDGNVSTVAYSPYNGSLYGVPGKGKTGNISMDVSNNIEMKIRTKNDSLKKISLIDELGASLSYNMAASTVRGATFPCVCASRPRGSIHSA